MFWDNEGQQLNSQSAEKNDSYFLPVKARNF